MASSHYIEIHIDEDGYAEASGTAYENAERNPQSFPVAYPEPFNRVGCGWGVLGGHVASLAQRLANNLGLDWDCCHQATLQMNLFCGTPDQYAQYRRELIDALAPLQTWVSLRPQAPQAAQQS